MSEFRFTDGNLIVLYARFTPENNEIPSHIQQRIKTCTDTYSMIANSKPDGNKTMVVIVSSTETADRVKQALIQGGVDQKIIASDTDSNNMSEAVSHIYSIIESKPNPPFVYFVASYWMQDIFTSTVVSKLKGFRVQFYGAIDQRAVATIEADKAAETPRKGTEYYKQKAKNKAVDVLLNVIFPD